MKKIVRKQKLVVAVEQVRTMSERKLAEVAGGLGTRSGTQTQISYCTTCVNG